MASIKKNQLKELTIDTANKKLAELRMELMKLNAKVAIGTNIESPGMIKSTKRNIAKLLTIINSLKKTKGDNVKKKEENKKK